MEVKKDHKTSAEILKAFKSWSAGRSGFTTTQLVELFSRLYNLSASETKTLADELKKEEDEKKTAQDKKKADEEAKKKKGVSAGLLITRTRFPKWWKDLRVSGITIVGSGVQTIVQGGSNYNVFIAGITIVTSGPTSVSFGFGTMGASGPMPLGDTGQPMGMTISMSDSPAPCGQGGFTVHSIGGSDTLGGFVVYYVEKVEMPGT